MPRYIDAEKIRPYKGFFEKVDNVPKFYDWVETLPTADAVEVVRCKECKHRDAETGFCEGRGWPMQLVHDDGFCDKGERSEDA